MDKNEATRIATQFREKFGAWLDLRVPGHILQKADTILQSILSPPPKLEWDFFAERSQWRSTHMLYLIRVTEDGRFKVEYAVPATFSAETETLADAKGQAQSHYKSSHDFSR